MQNPDLDVKVGKTRIIMRGSNRPQVVKSADGSVIVIGTAGRIKSMDGGDTWQPWREGLDLGFGVYSSTGQLADGTVLAVATLTEPVAGEPGTYVGEQWISTDNWQTITGPEPVYIEQIPELSTDMRDDGSQVLRGPKFIGPFITLDNGDLLGAMETSFKEDMKYGRYSGMWRWRAILIKSTDGGKHWSYVSTIASMDSLAASPEVAAQWQYAFCEPGFARLPNGNLVCAMRTGTYVGETALGDSYHDLSTTIKRDGKYYTTGPEPCKPIYVAISTNGGQSWSKPVPAGTAVGAWPQMLALSNGVLALSYGRLTRPSQGNSIIFSTDGGQTWTNEVSIFPGLSTGYTSIVETEPNKILYVFDAVTTWGPKGTPDWIGAVDIEVELR